MAEQILSLSLRPKRFSELFGQQALVSAIRKQMCVRPPRAWMFTGQTGGGKTTIARIVANSFQCPHQKMTRWGDPCDDCLKGSFDIYEVNASEVNGVEDMEKIAGISRYQPMAPSLKRVIILDECQRISSAGQNLLLKPLEDTPETTVWIICTTEPSKILATLRRRCMIYSVLPLTIADREAFLAKGAKAAGFSGDLTPLIEQIHTAQISSPALLLMALERFVSGMAADKAVAGTDAVGINTYAMCLALTKGNWVGVRKQLSAATAEEARWIRSSAVGWLRGRLLKESNPVEQKRIVASLGDLLGVAPLEDALLFPWLLAALWKVCRRYKLR